MLTTYLYYIGFRFSFRALRAPAATFCRQHRRVTAPAAAARHPQKHEPENNTLEAENLRKTDASPTRLHKKRPAIARWSTPVTPTGLKPVTF